MLARLVDSVERRTLLHQLAGAMVPVPSCLAFFLEKELVAHFQREEPQSALYDIADAAEALGMELSDIHYDEADPSQRK